MSINYFLLRSSLKNSSAYDLGYPTDEWAAQNTKYSEYDYHFSGQMLEEPVSVTNPALKYPLQFDPCMMPIFLHTSFLYGEVPDGASALVQPEVEIWEGGEKLSTDGAQEAAKKMTSFLRSVWEENGGRSKQLQIALDNQIYGGFVVGGFFAPEKMLEGEIPLSIVRLHPADFYPAWSSNDYDRLIAAEVGYAVTSLQAKEFGLEVDTNLALYHEMWTRKSYEITIEDQVINVNGVPSKGRPPAGLIPYVYVPHPPRVGFYGTSLLKDRSGMVKEINTRMTDAGDIVSEEAANIPAIRNTREVIIRRASGTKPFLDIGFQQGDRIPDIMYPGAKASSVQSASDYVQNLIDIIRGEMYCTPVLFGGDDGSQRSAATLALRSIPLIAHIREERGFYTSGMARLNKNLLLIAADKRIGGITLEMARMARVKSNWFPMLPRDAAQEVMTIISRVQAGILSPETSIEMIGDVLDISAELSKIKVWNRDRLEQERQLDPYAGAGRNGELAGLKKPSTKETSND